ncbi:hypothetical protein BS50DRAFT_581342 [Corynespora cassiicola Philippines]|uniref:Uncharacterized protein n=1 Tax=Corynespora cassiicola Philippines TaxID=1448308 RepID=A0A2T2PA56_CORCC|nr:hypothetical protein BS50DRAFT_581342 [Corynespora cassiicola Philippines]
MARLTLWLRGVVLTILKDPSRPRNRPNAPKRTKSGINKRDISSPTPVSTPFQSPQPSAQSAPQTRSPAQVHNSPSASPSSSNPSTRSGKSIKRKEISGPIPIAVPIPHAKDTTESFAQRMNRRPSNPMDPFAQLGIITSHTNANTNAAPIANADPKPQFNPPFPARSQSFTTRPDYALGYGHGHGHGHADIAPLDARSATMHLPVVFYEEEIEYNEKAQQGATVITIRRKEIRRREVRRERPRSGVGGGFGHSGIEVHRVGKRVSSRRVSTGLEAFDSQGVRIDMEDYRR